MPIQPCWIGEAGHCSSSLLGLLHYRDEELLGRLAWRVVYMPGQRRPKAQGVSLLAWAYGALEFHHPLLLQVLVKTAKAKVHRCALHAWGCCMCEWRKCKEDAAGLAAGTGEGAQVMEHPLLLLCPLLVSH